MSMLDWGTNAVTGANGNNLSLAMSANQPGMFSQQGQNSWLNSGAGSLMGGMSGINNGGGQPLNWWQNMQNGFNNSKFGSGMNSMAKSAGGWGNILGGASTIMEGLAAWDARKLGRDQFDLTKDSFLDNYGAQQKMIENNLRDTWDARNAMSIANGQSGYNQSQDSFLAQRGVADSRVGG